MSHPTAAVVPRYCQLGDAATYAGLSIRSMERLIAARRLPSYKLNRRRLVALDQLDRLIVSGVA